MVEILLIDDNEIEYQWLTALFDRNVNIKYVHNLELAKELVKQDKFDIIIIDMNLNGENGYSIYGELKYLDSMFIVTSSLLRNDGVKLEGNLLVVSKDHLKQEVDLIISGKTTWTQTDLKTTKNEH